MPRESTVKPPVATDPVEELRRRQLKAADTFARLWADLKEAEDSIVASTHRRDELREQVRRILEVAEPLMGIAPVADSPPTKKPSPPAKKPARVNKLPPLPKQGQKPAAVAAPAPKPAKVVTHKQTLNQYAASVRALAKTEGVAGWAGMPPPIIEQCHAKGDTVRAALIAWCDLGFTTTATKKPTAKKPDVIAKLPPGPEPRTLAEAGLERYTAEELGQAYAKVRDLAAGKVPGVVQNSEGQDYVVVDVDLGLDVPTFDLQAVVLEEEWTGMVMAWSADAPARLKGVRVVDTKGYGWVFAEERLRVVTAAAAAVAGGLS